MSTKKVKIAELLTKFHLEKVKIGPDWANVELSLKSEDQDAAWELYIEMLTRIATQPLPIEDGDEKAALDSVYSLFPITREVLRRYGRGTIHFSKVAVPVLNQVVRPFTAKWHRASLVGDLCRADRREEFREELVALQKELCNYNRMLADIAGVEDLTDIEHKGDC